MSDVDVHPAGEDATIDDLRASNPAIGETVDVDQLLAELRRLRRDNARLAVDVVELRRECEQLEQERDHWIQCFEDVADGES